jgi:GMP synthase (glutamine-hydrolysing)
VSKKILLIDHPKGKRDDRVSARLAARGHAVIWCSPGRGDPLPDPAEDYAAAVIYGGPESANDDATLPYIAEELRWLEGWVASEKPFLGLCLGAQMLARVLGARVSLHDAGQVEIGYVPVRAVPGQEAFLDGVSHVYHWHKEGFDRPVSAEPLVEGETFPNQAFRYGRRRYGLQFHPEVTPEVMRRWIAVAGHMLENPGAQAAERQIADAAIHDPRLSAWLDDFLDHWLED